MQALNTVTAMAFINSFISELLTDAINSSKFRLILSWVISNLSYYFVIFANYIVTQEVGCDPLLHNYTDTTGKPNCRYKNRKKDPASQVAGTGIGKGTRQNKLPVQELKKGPGKPNAGTRIEKGVR